MPPRLLAAKSEHGYTDDPGKALPEEPEAISAAEQRSLTRDADRRAQARRLADWEACRATISRELKTMSTLYALLDAPDVSGDLRAMRRYLERADKRVRTAG